MKLIEHFDSFLDETVNLNPTRVTQLEDSIEAIKTYVRGSDWAPHITEWAAQGSWAHKTIIKPVDNSEFDADLLVFVEAVDGWDAARYINELYVVFSESGVYQDKVRRWSHCITITYANERKIDIAPCVVNRLGWEHFEVCNRDSNAFEPSAPKNFTSWLLERNTWSGNNNFRKVTRLIKYLRDIKKTFTCSSVLLTTLLGYRILGPSSDGGALFTDTPTALKAIFDSLDDWLQMYPAKPAVANPFLLTEDFAQSLTDDQYSNLREMVSKYRDWIDDAYAEADRNESIGKWRRIFGDDFAKGAVVEAAASVSKAAIDNLRSRVITNISVTLPSDLVAAVKQYGVRALPDGFNNLPHMQRPKWKKASSGSSNVRVQASLYTGQGGSFIKNVASAEPLNAPNCLKFTAVTNAGMPLNASDYDVQWRITNTDKEASLDGIKAMRGGFYPSEGQSTRWEPLKYRGVHLAEAFVILKRTNQLVAQSDPFYVTIE